MIFFHGSGGGRMAVKLSTDDTASFSSYMQEVWSETVPEIPLQMSWLDESVSELYEQETRMLRLLSGVSIVAADERTTSSATRSASRSYLSSRAPIRSLGWISPLSSKLLVVRFPTVRCSEVKLDREG